MNVRQALIAHEKKVVDMVLSCQGDPVEVNSTSRNVLDSRDAFLAALSDSARDGNDGTQQPNGDASTSSGDKPSGYQPPVSDARPVSTADAPPKVRELIREWECDAKHQRRLMESEDIDEGAQAAARLAVFERCAAELEHLWFNEDAPPSTDSGEVVNMSVVGINEPTEETKSYVALRQGLRTVLWRDDFWPNNPGVGDDEIVEAVGRLMDERAILAAAQPDTAPKEK